MSASKWILGGLGFVLGGPIGAIIGVVIASLFSDSPALPRGEERTGQTETTSRRTRQKTSEIDIQVCLLVLISCVMKADGHVKRSELDMVKAFLLRNYGEDEALVLLKMLKVMLDEDIDEVVVSHQIAEHVNYSTRLELLHFLFELAHADGVVDDTEIAVIERIAGALNLSSADYRSLLAMYHKQQDVNWAYTVLEIEPSATNDEVKKAYRRMAMKYHPDKVASAGEDIKAKATEKFRTINEAYEHIKSLRGIV